MKDKQTIDVVDLIDRVPISRLQIRALLICAAIALLDGFDLQLIAFIAPAIGREWGVQPSAFGTIFGAGLVGLVIGSLGCGVIADRIGRKPVLVIAVAAFGVCSIATAYVNNMQELLWIRLLTGIGLGGALPNLISLASDFSPKRKRTLLVTLMFIGVPLGALLGAAIATKVVPASGWRVLFTAGGVLPLLLLPLLWLWLPESLRFLVAKRRDEKVVLAMAQRIAPEEKFDTATSFSVPEIAATTAPVVQLFEDGRKAGTILMWVIFFCNLFVMYFLISWLPLVLQQAGMPADKAIAGTVMLNLGGILGGITLGYMIDKRGAKMVLPFAYLTGAVAVGCIGIATSFGSASMAAIVAAGFFVIGTQFCMNGVSANYYPTVMRSTGVGWALGAGRVGSILGPVAGGFLLGTQWTLAQAFMVVALPCLVCALAVWLLVRGNLAQISAPSLAADALRHKEAS